MATSFSINEFKNRLRGGARPTLFKVSLKYPAAIVGAADATFFIEAAQLPASNLGLIQVPYFGRILKLPGDRTFDPWTVTVINDEEFKVRRAMEQWSSFINGYESNIRTSASGPDTESFKVDGVTVEQLSKTGETLRTYKFYGMFPQVVGAIDLSWEAMDQIERFQVTFEYDHFIIGNNPETVGTSGSISDVPSSRPLAVTLTDNRDLG